MRLKPDWQMHLHGLRRRELEQAFSGVPPGAFERALELGAGDGFQSVLLLRYVRMLISTDLNAERLRALTSAANYVICDAEMVESTFRDGSFDLVFSSNLLEHLPDLARALEGMRRVLRDDGVAVHVMPNRFWKLCQLCLYNPNRAVWLAERVLSSDRRRDALEVIARRFGCGPSRGGGRVNNNLKLRSAWRRLPLLPEPHGVAEAHLEEFLRFGRNAWIRAFEAAGFRIVRVMGGPVASGYGFGLDHVRALLERIGFSSEYIYVVAKAGQASRFESFFLPEA